MLSQDEYDLSRIHFLGRLPPHDLAGLFARSDLHVYLTAPFVLSWSLLNAMACGATVLASDTAPVREVIHHNDTGLLADFFDVDAMFRQANDVFDHPADFQGLGRSAVELIHDQYSLEKCLPKMLNLYERARNVNMRHHEGATSTLDKTNGFAASLGTTEQFDMNYQIEE